jgi:N,N'-diacetyllegionaminate synthase
MLISMGTREVGDGNPVFIVFEAGPTHTGLSTAKELAKHAREAGADAIKFQITDHKRMIQDHNLMFSYEVIDSDGNIETVTEPLSDIWERRWMPIEDWKALKSYCDEIGITFFATIFSEEDVDLVCEIGCQSIKIASQDTDYQDLIEYAASKGIPVQLDTGGSSLGEVERAVDWIREKGNNKIIINHCPSGYPARLESINLNVIQTLKKMYSYPIAFSDHTPGWEMDVAAVCVGANIIEKTITLDRTQRSCEHMMSLEPVEMKRFVEIIREVEIALGIHRRVVGSDEREKRKAIRRSPYLIREVRAGQIMQREDFEFRRPGFGIKPYEYHEYLGHCYKRDLKVGHMLSTDDV